jgi:hypothetical protein
MKSSISQVKGKWFVKACEVNGVDVSNIVESFVFRWAST